MLKPPRTSPCSKRASHRTSRLSSLVLLSATFLFQVPAVVAAQQAGAVPLAQGIADLASQLSKGIPEGHPMTVAVTDFPDLGGQTCRLGRYVAERLSTLLSQHPQCHLIERRRLDMVLQELKFSMSELVDPAKARRLGQMLGVQGLVLGTVSDVGSTLDLDARIIDIQTDVSLPGASASIVKDEAVKELSVNCSSPALPGVAGSELGPHAQPEGGVSNPVVPAQRLTAGALELELLSCQRRADKVQCAFQVKNLLEDHKYMILGQAYETVSRAVDDRGGMYPAEEVRIGDQVGRQYAETIMPSSVPVLCRLTFSGIPGDVSRLSLIEVHFTDDWNYRPRGPKFRLRDVPILPMGKP